VEDDHIAVGSDVVDRVVDVRRGTRADDCDRAAQRRKKVKSR
jgi:hypothetical protein